MCTHDVPEQAIIFVTHMTPPELYVTSDALAYVLILSTEYLRESCRTVGWISCQGSQGQSTTANASGKGFMNI